MGTLQGRKRSGQTRLSTSNGIPSYEETYDYVVVANSAAESYASLRSTPGLPVVGVSLSGIAVCRSLSGSQRENSLVWDFSAEFSSEVTENEDSNDDPNAWVPVYETKFERIVEPALEDVNGDPFTNSADQPYPNNLMIPRFLPIWTFSQFEPATVSDEDIVDRNETVNDGVFRGRAAKTLLMTVESSQLGFFYGARRRFTQYSLKYNSKTWAVKVLDKGTAYKQGGVSKAFAVQSPNSGPVVIEGGLDGSGLPAGGFNGVHPVNGTPATLTFDIYQPIDFSSFLRG
jgi:hypothetical protein